MRCVVAREKGGPEVLSVEERPVPQPRAGEVLIKVDYAGVSRPDIMQRKGIFVPPPGASDILGLEAAGTVVALGDRAEGLAIGDRVAALLLSGGYAEYVTTDARHCLKLPDALTTRDGGALPEVVFTVWHNLFELGRLTPGESVLIHGGASGIGTMAIQLAAATGARAYATVGSKDKQAALEALGCTQSILYKETDFTAAIKKATDARGVDVVLDIVGGSYVPRNISILAPGGRHVSLSFLESSTAAIDLGPVMGKSLTLTSSTLRPKSADEKARLKRAIEHHAWPLITSGRVKAVVHAEFPLTEAAKAHAMLEASQHVGKVLLRAA
jgi:putative PIG3 family NAD(P)H quinone oxidoreductase